MPSDPSLRAVLRAATRDLHERSEAAFVLGAPDVTRAEYVAALQHLLRHHEQAERALRPWAPALAELGIDLATREKSPALRADLAALGAPTLEADLPDALPLPSLAHALGVLYVLEGATLGGQLIRRQLLASLQLTPAAGLGFFAVYGEAVGPMWRAYGEALDRFAAARVLPGERAAAFAAAIAGARAGFLAFEHTVVRPTARPAARPVLVERA